MISVEDIKKSMRIKHDLLNSEITRNINTALLDMSRVGVNSKMDDSLMDKACELYCKAEFDYQGKGEEYRKKYESLRDSLSLAGKYKEHGGGNDEQQG